MVDQFEAWGDDHIKYTIVVKRQYRKLPNGERVEEEPILETVDGRRLERRAKGWYVLLDSNIVVQTDNPDAV